jgi:hypothetical protein
MDAVLRWLSVGAIADAIARASGWSPVGHRITLSGAEGPEAALLEGCSARVTGIFSGEMTAELVSGHERRAEGLFRLKLTPRHVGWTPFSLMLTGIAVVVQDTAADEKSGAIGIATARLVRGTAIERYRRALKGGMSQNAPN